MVILKEFPHKSALFRLVISWHIDIGDRLIPVARSFESIVGFYISNPNSKFNF